MSCRMISSILLLLAGGLVLFVATFWLQIVGYRWGRSQAAEATPEARHGLSVVEGAVFALLGLIVAFQFAGAASRLHDRRDLAIQEANAISTAYLRLDLLPRDTAAEMRRAFGRYIAARLQYIESKLDFAAADQAQASPSGCSRKSGPTPWRRSRNDRTRLPSGSCSLH